MRRVATLLRRFPWVATFMTYLWRLGRPHFTVGAVGLVLDEQNRVLLVEHVFHPHSPWGLPGGWVDRGEPLAVSASRELLEELELNVVVKRVLLVEISKMHPNHIDVVYLCEPAGAVGKLSHELLQYAWFSFDELPPVSKLHYRAIELAISLKSVG